MHPSFVKFGAALTISIWICAASGALANEVATRTLKVGDTERKYILSKPEADGPRPTIFILHGGGMSANHSLRTNGMEPLVEREKLVAVYPNALRREWNDGREVRMKERGYADDVAYMRALVKALVAEGIADPKHIYVTGASNGGMMSLRLICEAADIFAAAVPIIANLPSDIAGNCKPSRAVPVLVINGTADPLVPYTGGGVGFAGRRGNVISTDATMAQLRRFNGCPDGGKSERLPDRDPNDGSTITVTSWTNCLSGAAVVLYRVDGGGHRIPHLKGNPMPMIDRMLGNENHDIDAPEVIWAFFRDKSL
jgi:polyhydroxybutyrate depolymerase